MVDDDGKAQRLPWELWHGHEDDDASAWMRATSPSGNADFVGQVLWSNELGKGIVKPELGQLAVDGEQSSETQIQITPRDKVRKDS